MKTTMVVLTCIAWLLMLTLATPTFAAEGKEVTIKGDAKCAKCALKETEKCQTVIQAEEDGKTVTYYLANNKTAKEFHENVCKEAKKATATGTVKEVDGKKQLMATKIELAKD